MTDFGKHRLSFGKEHLLPQEERLAIAQRRGGISIGIPKEITMSEHRVALVPNSISALTARGHKLIIEEGAGVGSNFGDHDYSEAGAQISKSKEEVFNCDIVLKVAPPTSDEIKLFRPNQILISPLQIPIINQEYVELLCEKKVVAVAMEYLQADDGSFPVVRIMSEMAGISAVVTAANLLGNDKGGRGTLLGGVSGVPPAKVVILGAGVVGEFATRAALGLGADVRIFDNNIHKLMRIQKLIGRPLPTSSINDIYLGYQLLSADVVIGAIHSQTGRAPVVVSEEMVMKMKDGSVVVDVSIDQGGCFETSEVTTHKNPTFVKHGVTHYCVPNIAAKVSRTASVAVSNIMTPILVSAGDTGSIEQLFYDHPGLRNGVYVYKGCVTNKYLGDRFGIKYTNLDLLLTSSM